MGKYRKKPVVVEAVQFDGINFKECLDFVGDVGHRGRKNFMPESENLIYIQTLEGTMQTNVGDYIIKGVNGEFYPCKPDIFEKTYDNIQEETK